MNTSIITLGVQIDRFTSSSISNEVSNTVISFQNVNDFAIDPTIVFGGVLNVVQFVDLQSIESTTDISVIEDIDVRFTVGGITSTISVGDINLDRFLAAPQIVSVSSVGNPLTFISIGATSVDSTVQFGINSINRPVHRSLIFKDDNITQLGANDAVEVASGIIFNPSIDKLTSNSAGAVDLRVDVDGASFSLPLVNNDSSGQLVIRSELDAYLQVANADSLSIDTSNLAANSYVNDQLALKADLTDLDNYLQVANVDQITVDTSNLAQNTYVNSTFTTKTESVASNNAIKDLIDNKLDVANLVSINSDIIPSANVAFDLGTPSLAWRDLYLSGNSIFLGTVPITREGNSIRLPENSRIGNDTFDNRFALLADFNAERTRLRADISDRIQVANVSSVGLSGNYNDLTNKPDLSIYATTSYVNDEIAGIVNSAPETLDTLNELAAALGDDANFSTTILNSLGTKASNTYVNTTFTTKTDAVAANNTLLSLIEDRIQVANASATFVTKTEAVAANNTLISLIEDRIEVANLASVATSGSYNDLSNLPNLGQYLQVANVASVATSGSYNDLSNTPTNVSSFSNDAGYLTTVAFGDLTSTPTTLSGYGITDAATSTQGSLADSAVQPNDNISTLTNDAGYITSADGGDADTLDGQQGSYYTNAGNLTGTIGDVFSTATRYSIGLTNGSTAQTRDKLRVWNAGAYAIGMKSGFTYGALNDYAMSFQMNSDADRGWWWGDDSHTDAQGAMSLTTNGRATIATSLSVGKGESTTSAPSSTLEVNGSLTATSKSFVIDHPSKPGHKLRYGSLEGPENGVYVRGKSTDKTITLPDYWKDLVHEDSITVQLTPIGSGTCFVKQYGVSEVKVGGTAKEFFYFVQGERKDVERFEVEYED